MNDWKKTTNEYLAYRGFASSAVCTGNTQDQRRIGSFVVVEGMSFECRFRPVPVGNAATWANVPYKASDLHGVSPSRFCRRPMPGEMATETETAIDVEVLDTSGGAPMLAVVLWDIASETPEGISVHFKRLFVSGARTAALRYAAGTRPVSGHLPLSAHTSVPETVLTLQCIAVHEPAFFTYTTNDGSDAFRARVSSLMAPLFEFLLAVVFAETGRRDASDVLRGLWLTFSHLNVPNCLPDVAIPILSFLEPVNFLFDPGVIRDGFRGFAIVTEEDAEFASSVAQARPVLPIPIVDGKACFDDPLAALERSRASLVSMDVPATVCTAFQAAEAALDLGHPQPRLCTRERVKILENAFDVQKSSAEQLDAYACALVALQPLSLEFGLLVNAATSLLACACGDETPTFYAFAHARCPLNDVACIRFFVDK